MEEYERFARRRVSQLREEAAAAGACGSARPSRGASSFITFNGVAVLPPLLTEQKRAKMLEYKEQAMRLARRRGKAQPDPRMSQVQTLLDSVQPRKAPTLQEFIQSEPDVVATGSTAWDFPPPLCSTAKPMHDGKVDELSFHHLTTISSVAADAIDCPDLCSEASRVTDAGSAFDVHQTTNTQGHASQQSLSSGYITSDNVETTGHISATREDVHLPKDRDQVTQEGFVPLDSDGLGEGAETVLKQGALASRSLEPGHCEREEPGACEVPCCVSLQNLLKQSQEYRQRQRHLRMARIRAQETAETQNLSDKENSEVPLMDKTELRKSKERRANHAKVQFSQLIPSRVDVDRLLDRTSPEVSVVQSSVRTSLERSEKVIDCGRVNVSEVMGEDHQVSVVSPPSEPPDADDLDRRNLMPSAPRDDTTNDLPKSMSITPYCAKPFSLSEGQKMDGSVPRQSSATKKFATFPAPQLCSSPVRRTKGQRPTKTLVVNAALSVSDSTGLPAPTSDSVDRSVQISQLEMNLSSLKALISDLESTLVEGSNRDAWAEESYNWGEHSVPPRKMLGHAEQQLSKHYITSLAQKMRVPETFRATPAVPRRSPILADTSNQLPPKDSSDPANRSYDVETPSSLWQQADPIGVGLQSQISPTAHSQGSRAKRRLLMSNIEENSPATLAASDSVTRGWPGSSTSRVQLSSLEDRQPQPTQTQGEPTQVSVKERELQRITARYQQLCYLSPHPRDVPTSGPLGSSVVRHPVLNVSVSQASRRSSSSWRPLVAAAVKGYLTRRLLRTEHVARLLRAVKDSQDFLLASQTPGMEAFEDGQDLMLQKRVLLQLRSARYEIYDVFFGSSAVERMQIISRDRTLSRERELRRRENGQEPHKGRVCLSAATRKSLERRSSAFQKKAGERPRAGWRRTCEQPRQERTSTLNSRLR